VRDAPLSAAPPGRTLWRCRRGMRELDVLLERFARGVLPGASPAERHSFDELLELPDPLLAGYFLGGDTPPEAHLALLVARIRAYVA
jgi:antitoxin CptB